MILRRIDELLERLFWRWAAPALVHGHQTYLVDLRMKQDQMSMAASIEVRVPFLDHELAEFTASIPAK